MKRIRQAGNCLVLAWLVSMPPAPSLAGSAPMKPCKDAAPESWVADLRERMLSFDLLGRHAVERFGAPTACRGEVTAEFDGLEFGRLRFEFPGGAVLQVESSPPESSRVTLTVPGGFPDPDEARRLLRAYADEIGAEIDWSAPAVAEEGAATVETCWAVEADLNVSAQVVTSGGKILTLSFAMAL